MNPIFPPSSFLSKLLPHCLHSIPVSSSTHFLPVSFHVCPTLFVSLFPSHTLQQVELQCGQTEFQFHLQRKSFSIEVSGMDKNSQESICQILLLSYKYFWHTFRDLWFSQTWGRFLGGESPRSKGKLEFNCCVNSPIKVQLGLWLKQSSLYPAAKLPGHVPAGCVLRSQTMFPVCSTWWERSQCPPSLTESFYPVQKYISEVFYQMLNTLGNFPHSPAFLSVDDISWKKAKQSIVRAENVWHKHFRLKY